MGAEDPGPQNVIQNVVVLGGGSAGLIAALTLKRKLPQLAVRVIRSPEIGVIGVGEGTTAAFPRHFFEYLKVSPAEFYAGTEPTWKLGIRFLWGPRRQFHYTFANEYTQRWPGLRRNIGFYHETDTRFVGPVSALMAHDKAFARKGDGTPQFHNHHAFHIENQKLVAHLESVCREACIEIRDANVKRAEVGRANVAGHEEQIIEALVLENGERVTADLYLDASGFRSELLGWALSEPVISYEASLFCDRAVIGGWRSRTLTTSKEMRFSSRVALPRRSFPGARSIDTALPVPLELQSILGQPFRTLWEARTGPCTEPVRYSPPTAKKSSSLEAYRLLPLTSICRMD